MTEIERIKANVQGMRSDAEQHLAQLRVKLRNMRVAESNDYKALLKLAIDIELTEAEVQAYSNVLNVMNGGKYSV